MYSDNILTKRGNINALLDWSNVTIAEQKRDIAKTCILIQVGPISNK